MSGPDASSLARMTSPGLRHVSSTTTVDVTETADLVFSVAVVSTVRPVGETLSVTLDGAPLDPAHLTEIVDAGTRLHRIAAAPVGQLVVAYEATVPTPEHAAIPVTDLDRVVYTRPSRYCDSDRLAAVAATHFGGLTGRQLVDAVVTWVHDQVAYTPGSSGVTDGALDVYLSRRGVCRDMAQLVVTFARALGVPARLASVYAPGLDPMDFHAVAEVALDGHWCVVDATRLAPRASLVRIATGRDAADTAFLTVNAGRADLVALSVLAIVDPDLPVEDAGAIVHLA